jgi:hypothetical protein
MTAWVGSNPSISSSSWATFEGALDVHMISSGFLPEAGTAGLPAPIPMTYHVCIS